MYETLSPSCYKSVAKEMKDAGALYEDKEVIVDSNLITSRHPSALPAFMRETIEDDTIEI